MHSYINYYILSLFSFLLCFILSCTHEIPTPSDVEIKELQNFETLVNVKENILAIPVLIKHKDEMNFLVYDVGLSQVLELDENGSIVNKIGRTGRGPGEYLSVNNIFINEHYLYVTDTVQLLIHQYNKENVLLSSFDFGELSGRPTVPGPAVGGIKPNDIDNQPTVTIHDDIVLSTANVGTTEQYIFEVIDWEDRNQLSKMGEVPVGSSFVLNNQQLRNEAINGEIPSFYKANSFPIQDRANPDEFFIIYSSLPKIAKYASNGKKLWEHRIKSSETDKIKTHFFEQMDQMSKSPDIRDRVDLKFYSSGISSDEGALYLVANTKPVVIHQFNNTGELVRKYKFTSEDVTPILDIDFNNKRILAVSEEGGIRAYPYK